MRFRENLGIEGYGSVNESTIPDKYGCIYIKHGNYLTLMREATRGTGAWEKWCIYHGCLLQANNGNNEGGCDKCSLDDFDLDWCPWHPECDN